MNNKINPFNSGYERTFKVFNFFITKKIHSLFMICVFFVTFSFLSCGYFFPGDDNGNDHNTVGTLYMYGSIISRANNQPLEGYTVTGLSQSDITDDYGRYHMTIPAGNTICAINVKDEEGNEKGTFEFKLNGEGSFDLMSGRRISQF